ncbi:hypothetical protein BFJ72_g5803 [Fusarium proliferatum]|uniref:Uncharacterized protein n=1 Tax=Gibberella intermedia TaxID=948311 RepID=A0A420TIP1_GIBIN|nr:hypothetical protein BFJ72_g5803 [Fusarium proliferatum]
MTTNSFGSALPRFDFPRQPAAPKLTAQAARAFPTVAIVATAGRLLAHDVNENEPNRPAAGPPRPCEAHAGFNLHKNYPRRIQDTSKIDVPNPNSIIDKAIPKTGELAELVSKLYTDVLNEDLDACRDCAVTALNMPVFIL